MALNYNINTLESFLVVLIHNNETLRGAFLDEFSELSADIESFKSNYNCGCRKKIELFISKNRDIVSNFLKQFYNSNPSLHDTIEEAIKTFSGYKVSGKVFEINDTQEAFASFYEKMLQEKFTFDNMYIIKSAEGKIKIYFL